MQLQMAFFVLRKALKRVESHAGWGRGARELLRGAPARSGEAEVEGLGGQATAAGCEDLVRAGQGVRALACLLVQESQLVLI